MSNLRISSIVAAIMLVAASGAGHSQTLDPSTKVTQSDEAGYVSVGVVVFKRSDPKGGPIVVANPSLTPSFVSSDDYDFGWKAGIDAAAGINFWSSEGLEARVLYFDTNAANQITTPGNFIGAGFTGPGGTLFQSEYDTKLTSFEVNWRHRMFDHLTLLAGVRSISVDDKLHYDIATTVAHADYNYDNHLLGGQIGAEWAVFKPSNPFQVNLVGKFGVYALHSSGGIFESSGVNSNPIGSFTTDVRKTAYAGELGISAGYHLTNNIQIRGGYQLLWLDKVGLASNNAAFSLTNPSLLSHDLQRDNLLFHGFNVGVTVNW